MKSFYCRPFVPVIGILSLFLLLGSAEAFWFWPKKNEPKKTVVAEAPPLSLKEAYRLALKKSETIALSAEEIQQAQARFYRSFNYFLPEVTYTMSRKDQDVAEDSSGSDSGISSDARRRTTPENKFTFTQPLFSGFRELAALQASGADKKQQRLKWQRAKELLFIDVMNAYYGVLEAEDNADTLLMTRRLGARRFKELNRRVSRGRSRGTDRQSALADLQLTQSEWVEARALIDVSRRLLEFYTGEPLVRRRLAKNPVVHVPLSAPALGTAKGRADVQAAEQGFILADKRVITARAGFLPTVKATGNYYTRRIGFQSGNDWDVTLQMDVPVFGEVGTTLGDVKAAESTRESERLKWSQSRRTAELDTDNAFQDWRAASRGEKALDKARRVAEENYRLVSNDYRMSLVNNLEVLDALRRFQDIQIRYNGAHYRMQKNYWKFKTALGQVLDEVEK